MIKKTLLVTFFAILGCVFSNVVLATCGTCGKDMVDPSMYRNIPMDVVTRAEYQKYLEQKGPITIELVEKSTPELSINKIVNKGKSLCLLKAIGKQPIYLGSLKLHVDERTPFVKLEKKGSRWELYIDDGGRNKIVLLISRRGNVTVKSALCKDDLNIKTTSSLTFSGKSEFTNLYLEVRDVHNQGSIKTDSLSVELLDGIKSNFSNNGDLEVAKLNIDGSSFSNKNKIFSKKDLNLNIKSGEFTNHKDKNRNGEIFANNLNLSGEKGFFINRGSLEIETIKGSVFEFANHGIVNITNDEKSTTLKGEKFSNKYHWYSSNHVDLNFSDIKNGGIFAVSSLKLQSDGEIENDLGSTLEVGKDAHISGECFLTNKGDIKIYDKLNLKVNSTINGGLMFSKNILQIDTENNYFKNIDEGTIRTDGVLKVVGDKGSSWINAGTIIAKELHSDNAFWNMGSGTAFFEVAYLSGELLNYAKFKTNKMYANLENIMGPGELSMDNGQMHIEKKHLQLGKWKCFGQCDWSAQKLSIFGDIEGNGPRLMINSTNDDLWHGGNLKCSSESFCETASSGKTVNLPYSSTVSDGYVKQLSDGSMRLEGDVSGRGRYFGTSHKDINHIGNTDMLSNVRLEAGENLNIIKKSSVRSRDGNVNVKAEKQINQESKVYADGEFESISDDFINTGETVSKGNFDVVTNRNFENKNGATLASEFGSGKVEAENIYNDGKMTTDGEFESISDGFINTGETVSKGNFDVKTNQNFENKKGATLASESGSGKVEAENVLNDANIDTDGELEIIADKNLKNLRNGNTNSGSNSIFKAENVDNDGKMTTDGEFEGYAKNKFKNNNEIISEGNLNIVAGEEAENTEEGILLSRNGVAKLDSKIVTNRGKILSKEKLKIFASKLFLNEDGTLATWGNATINAERVENIAGRILVAQLLKIHAKKLENKPKPTVMIPGENCPNPAMGSTRTCQGSYEVETSDAAIISSMGNIELDVGDGTNLASTIYARGDIKIDGGKFKNLARNLKNYKVTKSWRTWETCIFWFFCEDHHEVVTKVKNEPDYVGATLSADGDIIINDGVSFFENTGNVRGENFNLIDEKQTSKLINGLFDPYTLTAKKPKSKAGNIKIYDYMDKFGNLIFFRIADDDEIDPVNGKKIQYIIIPSSEADQKTLNQQVGLATRGLTESPQMAYLQSKDNKSPLSHDFIMFPQLSAQVLQYTLITELGRSRLKGFENKTAMEQYEILERRGYHYAQKLSSNYKKEALPLTLNQIKNSNGLFIYYDLVEHKGKVGYAPILHIGKEEAEQYVPDTEGSIDVSNMHVVVGDMVNTGTVRSSGDIKVKARRFKNRRREYKEIETVKDQKDIWGNTITRVFEVRTPQIGGNIIGVNVELVAKEDVINDGGEIEGEQNVYLISEEGNVEHKAFVGSHVVRWGLTSWDKIWGHSSATEALDYYPAKIISGRKIKLEAKQKKVLIKASKIIGVDNINISGYEEVRIEGAMSKNTKYCSSSIFNENCEEEVHEQSSTFTALEGDIKFDSKGGSICASNLIVDALRGAVTLDAKERVYLGPESINYKKRMTRASGGFSVGSTTTEITQSVVGNTAINALNGISIKSGGDNVLEAVLFNSGDYIHIVAGRDNHFIGFDKKTTITTEGWNIGISFPGSAAIKKMIEGDKSGGIKRLLDGDPLLSAINRFKLAKDSANKVGEGTYVAIEALRALDQYVDSSSAGLSLGAALGQRMGLTDAKGKFAPKITLRVGAFKSETEMTEVIKTALKAQGEVKINSGRDTNVIDGTTIDADRVIIAAKGDVRFGSAKNRIDSEHQSGSLSVSYGKGWSFGASYGEGHRNTLTNQNSQVNARVIEIEGKDFIVTGGELNGDEIFIDVENDFVLESMQNTDKGRNTLFSFDTSGSASFSHDSIDKKSVDVPSSIRARKLLKVHVGGKIYLIGGVMDGPKDATDIKANEFEAKDIDDHEDSSSFGVHVQFPIGNDHDSSVSGVGDVGYSKESYQGNTRATISKNAHLDINKIIGDLTSVNRDLDKIQTGSSDETHFSVVAPMLNLDKIQENINHINTILEGSKKVDDKPDEIYVEEDDEDEEYDEIIDLLKEYLESEQTENNHEEDQDIPEEDIIITESGSVIIDDYEITVTSLDLIDADGESLGELKFGEFKPGKEKTETKEPKPNDKEDSLVPEYDPPPTETYPTFSFESIDGKQTLMVNAENGRKYVFQGDKKTLNKLEAFAETFLSRSTALADGFTKGGTRWVREKRGVDHGVDVNSSDYIRYARLGDIISDIVVVGPALKGIKNTIRLNKAAWFLIFAYSNFETAKTIKKFILNEPDLSRRCDECEKDAMDVSHTVINRFLERD